MHMLVFLCVISAYKIIVLRQFCHIVPACCHVEFTIAAMESKSEMSKNGKLINLRSLPIPEYLRCWWLGLALPRCEFMFDV
jgi:hypothetical protein